MIKTYRGHGMEKNTLFLQEPQIASVIIRRYPSLICTRSVQTLKKNHHPMGARKFRGYTFGPGGSSLVQV